MKTLLKTEWLKIKNYSAFKVLMICFAAGVILANYIVYLLTKQVISANATGKMLMDSYQPYDFVNTWHTTSYVTGCLLGLPAMLILILVTNEYTYRTNRQNIIDGWSRSEFILVKLLMALILAVATTVLVFITAASFGFITKTDFSTTGIESVGFFFLKALTYNIFAILISVLIKRTGFAIGLFFIYVGAENFLSLWLLSKSMQWKASGTDMGDLGSYLPMNAADGLIPFPDNPLKAATRSISPQDYIWVMLAFAIAWLALFIWWSRRKYMKADL